MSSVRDWDAHYPRPMTVADAARLVSRAYAAAAERRKDIADLDRAIETYARQRDYAIDQGDERWRKVGTLAQYGHRTGVRPNHAMSTHERDEKAAAGCLAAEEQKRAERSTALPEPQRGRTKPWRLYSPRPKQSWPSCRNAPLLPSSFSRRRCRRRENAIGPERFTAGVTEAAKASSGRKGARPR
jgi:hypothetical protein